ncbi:MAG TPA: hypothetical protein PKH59_00740 [Candidatus Woesebacteria bacterium]|nr:hypothetical protein [Candidatus Woesebacteria bacterium]
MAFWEKYWDCHACGRTGISALRQLKCPGCGSVKSPQDKEHFSKNEITDEYGLALAKGAPYWTCSHCGSVNLDRELSCIGCGNERETSDESNRVVELGTNPLPDYQPKDVWQTYSESSQPKETVSRTKKEPGFQESWQSSGVLDKKELKRPQKSYTKITAVVMAVILGLVGLGWLFFHTTSMEATVTGFTWSRTVKIEKYETVHSSGWSLPPGAYNYWSETRISGYNPIYETRTRTVHHPQTSYRDLGNGAVESYDSSYYTTETYQEMVGQEPIYGTWYNYDVDQWNYERQVEAEEKDRNPYWPKYSLNFDGQTRIGAERVNGRDETYTIMFETVNKKGETKTYSYNTSENEWKRYQYGVSYPLKINHLGMIANNPLQDKEKPK